MFELSINKLPLISWILVGTGGLTVFFTLQSVRFRSSIGAWAFISLMLCVVFYSFGYAFELAAADLDTALFFSGVQYIGIPFIPFFYYMLIWQYLMRTNKIPLMIVLILLVIPVLTFILHITQNYHQYYYIEPFLVFNDGLSILNFDKGFWYYVNRIYSIIIMMLGIIHCIIRLIRDQTYRSRIAVLLIGALIPYGGFLLYASGFSPRNIDTTPIAMALSCPFLSISVFHYSFFEIVPVARDYIFENLQDCILVTDLQGRVIEYNGSTRKVFPYIQSYKIGTPLVDIVLNHKDELSGIENVLKGHSDQLLVKREEGELCYSVFRGTLESTKYFSGGKVYILSDVTEQLIMNKKLSRLASTDPLTGIFNRRKLLESAQNEVLRAIRYERELSLVFFDIDHFKKINDTHGHQAGDFVLQKTAELCRNVLREVDIFGRYGGEEFLLFLIETSKGDALAAAEKIREAFECHAYNYDGRQINVTASFGVSELRREDTLDAVLHRADEALYKAKSEGRNRICSL